MTDQEARFDRLKGEIIAGCLENISTLKKLYELEKGRNRLEANYALEMIEWNRECIKRFENLKL
jgi:hypothetical protein